MKQLIGTAGKTSKFRIAGYVALYGLAAIQAWDILAWIF